MVYSYIMNKAIALKALKHKKSKSVFDPSQKNEFMAVKLKFNTIQTQRTQQIFDNSQEIQRNYASLSPQKSTNKTSGRKNRSIKYILAEIKKQQRQERQINQQIKKRELEEKLFENRLKQFEVAERRIKRRLQIEQRRVQNKASDFTLHQGSNIQPSFQKQLVKTSSVDDSSRKNDQAKEILQQSSFSDRKLFVQYSVFSEPNMPNMPKYHKLVVPNAQLTIQSNNRQKNASTVVQINKFNRQRNRNFEKLAIKKKKKINIQLETIEPQNNIKQKHVPKHDQHTSPRNRSTIERQLERIYRGSTKQTYQRAAQLVDKMSARRRLKLKNNQEMDYVQASNKIKLLHYFYDLQN